MSQDETISKTGRKTKLTEKKMKATREAILNDANNKELAKILGVSVTTLTNWRSNSEEFLLVYESAKHEKNKLVEASLFNRAVGYKYDKTMVTTDKNGEQRTVTEEIFVQPDIAAQQFWLKNKAADEWKDKTEQHITGKLDSHVSTETPEEQLQRIKEMVKDESK